MRQRLLCRQPPLGIHHDQSVDKVLRLLAQSLGRPLWIVECASDNLLEEFLLIVRLGIEGHSLREEEVGDHPGRPQIALSAIAPLTRLAIKSMNTKANNTNTALLKSEITLLQRIDHRNVVKVVDVIQDKEVIHIIMEQCRGGDLFDITVGGKKRLSESKIRQIVGSLLDAIAYLHERQIVHRDLKVSWGES